MGSLWPKLRRWTFIRGFLDTIRVPVAVYLAHAEPERPATVRLLEVDLTGLEVPIEVLELMPECLARETIVVPIGYRDGTLLLAALDPSDTPLMKELRFILYCELKVVAAPSEQIVLANSRLYGVLLVVPI